MNRRSALGRAIGGLFLATQGKALRVAAEPVGPVMGVMSEINSTIGDPGAIPYEPSIDSKTWDLIHELMRPSEREHERFKYTVYRLGGHTPKVYSNHSWSPWFKAMVSAKEIIERESRQADASSSLRDKAKKGLLKAVGL